MKQHQPMSRMDRFAHAMDLNAIASSEFVRLLTVAHAEGLLSEALKKAGLGQMAQRPGDSGTPSLAMGRPYRLSGFLQSMCRPFR